MSTRVKVIYIALDSEKGVPIITAETFEKLKEGLDKYYGIDKEMAEYLGFTPHEFSYPSDYDGYHEYRWKIILNDEEETGIDRIKVFCLNLYPERIEDSTSYSKDQNEDDLIYLTRTEILETIVKILAKQWFYGDWKWETPSERVQEMLMGWLGYYPYNDEDSMIEETKVSEAFYKRAIREIQGKKSGNPEDDLSCSNPSLSDSGEGKE